MPFSNEHFGKNTSNGGLIVDNQHSPCQIRAVRGRSRLALLALEARQYDRKAAAPMRLALDLYVSVMPLDDSVTLAKPHSQTRLSLGRKEGLEDPMLDFLRHADAGVGEFDARVRLVRRGPNRDRNRAADRHRVERIQDHVDENFAQLRRLSVYEEIFGLRLQFDLVLDAQRFCVIAPSWARDVNRIANDVRQTKRDQVFFVRTLAREVLYALNHSRRIFCGLFDDSQVLFRVRFLHPGNSQLGVADHGGKRVIEIVSDARGQLAERAKLVGLLSARMLAVLFGNISYEHDGSGGFFPPVKKW